MYKEGLPLIYSGEVKLIELHKLIRSIKCLLSNRLLLYINYEPSTKDFHFDSDDIGVPPEVLAGGDVAGCLLRRVCHILYKHVLCKVLISSWAKIQDKFSILQIISIGMVGTEYWRSMEPVHMACTQADHSNLHVLLKPLHYLAS